MRFQVLDAGRPLVRRQTLEELERGGTLAYHGIVPRQLVEAAPEAAGWWPVLAPVIEHVWNEHTWTRASSLVERATSARARLRAHLAIRGRTAAAWSEPSRRELAAAIEAVRAARVLSASQAAEAAVDYLGRDGLRECLAPWHVEPDELHAIELDRVKEGHTASVFRLSCRSAGGRSLRFAIHVARDALGAAGELLANACDLGSWSKREPDRVAAVLAAGTGRCAWFGETLSVPVVAMTWLDDYLEAHVLRDGDGRGRVAIVESFVPRAGDRLRRSAGSVLHAGASDQVWASIVELRTRLAVLDWPDGTATVPALELNDGDVVVRAGSGPFETAIVGAEASPWRGAIGAWPYEAALAGVRSEHGVLRWGRARLAIEAVLRGLDGAHRREVVRRAVLLGRACERLAGPGDVDAREIIAVTEATLAELDRRSSPAPRISAGSGSDMLAIPRARRRPCIQ